MNDSRAIISTCSLSQWCRFMSFSTIVSKRALVMGSMRRETDWTGAASGGALRSGFRSSPCPGLLV